MRGMEASRTIEVTTLGECLASFVADTPGPMAEASRFTRYVAGAEANVAVGLGEASVVVGEGDGGRLGVGVA